MLRRRVAELEAHAEKAEARLGAEKKVLELHFRSLINQMGNIKSLLDEIGDPIYDDARLPYVTVQIGREAWEQIVARREGE